MIGVGEYEQGGPGNGTRRGRIKGRVSIGAPRSTDGLSNGLTGIAMRAQFCFAGSCIVAAGNHVFRLRFLSGAHVLHTWCARASVGNSAHHSADARRTHHGRNLVLIDTSRADPDVRDRVLELGGGRWLAMSRRPA